MAQFSLPKLENNEGSERLEDALALGAVIEQKGAKIKRSRTKAARLGVTGVLVLGHHIQDKLYGYSLSGRTFNPILKLTYWVEVPPNNKS